MYALLLFTTLAAALQLGPHGMRLLTADARATARPGRGRHRRYGCHAAPRSRSHPHGLEVAG